MPSLADLLALKKAMSTKYLAKATTQAVSTFAAAASVTVLLVEILNNMSLLSWFRRLVSVDSSSAFDHAGPCENVCGLVVVFL